MAKVTKLLLASMAVLAIFIIFAHPATLLPPATHANDASIFHLLITAIGGLVVPVAVLTPQCLYSFEAPQLACDSSSRLALICTRLC
ncbi:MAG: hypothetical protein ACM3PW_08605 [Chlamydiota bacterium]